jgi:putative DNA primase/helicase
MFVGTNHLPAVTDTSLFTSDRVRVIPFNRHFNEAERDMTLKQTLSRPENLSGVLNWCLRGLQMLEAEGFTIPVAVKLATGDYAEMSDKVGNFISEALIYSPGEKTDARMVFSRYQDWCYANGFKAEGFSEFRKSLASAGIEVKRMTPKGGDRNSTKINGIADYMLCDSA